MRRGTLVRLWIVIVAGAAAAIWLQSRLSPHSKAPAHSGLSPVSAMLIVAAATGIYAIYSWLKWRQLARYLRRMEDYAARLPSNTVDLPDELPREFALLLSALRRTSQHVSSVIDRANLELARRETILAGMAEGVLAVDRELKVTFCNETFSDAFSTRRPLPEGRPLYEVVREPILREILDEVLTTGFSEKRRVHLPAAGGRWFEVHALPLPSGAIAVLHDVTEMQRQEQARKDFVANVSHELRTPLAAIRGYAETLLDGAVEDPAINRKFIAIIQAHAIRLNNIASDLLVLSELDARAPDAPGSPVSISEVFESAARSVETAAAQNNVTVQINACENAVAIGNRLRLEQIVVNLLDNAVKFNRPSGSVTVDCAFNESTLIISISDTGIGIPSEDLKRIFDRFYRVDKARSRRVGGTGLGLSIVKESLERMGGCIMVESRLGQGTRFTLQLPRYVPEPASDNPATAQKESPVGDRPARPASSEKPG
jgi:two-component system phosphate regulon sensor histidine kinase PhoR